MILDKLTLIAGAPIPMPELKAIVHQPTIREIALMGERNFYTYLSYFNISKDVFIDTLTSNMEDLISINNIYEEFSDKTDFQIFLFLNIADLNIQKGTESILKLIFKGLEDLSFNDMYVEFTSKQGQQSIINESIFLIIKDILNQIFCLNNSSKKENEANALVREINKKLEERKQKLSKNSSSKDDYILANFISILSVGSSSLSLDDLLKMTVYQLINVMKRYGLYTQYTAQTQALMQGAENIELVDWFEQL